MVFPVYDLHLNSAKVIIYCMKRNTLALLIILIIAYGCQAVWNSTLAPGELLCENLKNPLGIATAEPRLSWINRSEINGASQTAYRILAASSLELLAGESGNLWDTGKVRSDESVFIPWNGNPLESRSLVYWKVKTWDQNDISSGWSSPAEFSVGLLEKDDWQAEYIGLSTEDGDPDFPQLRENFEISGIDGRALLHINSLGYHEAYINNRKVDDSVLTPAVSQMNKRTFTVTYDVTPLLRGGSNTLAIWLGEGWFHDGLPGVDYAGPLVKAQLEIQTPGDWETVVSTGKGWKARPSEITRIGTWHSGRYGGEKVDARKAIAEFASPGLDDSSWPDAAVVKIPERLTVPQKAELNRIRETFSPFEIREFGDKKTWLVDFGRNLTGWVEVNFSGVKTGQEIKMEFADFFLEDGSLKIHNQQDIYIAGPQEEQVFRNRFNYHGFRYMTIKGLREKPKPESIKAFLIQTDYKIASSFESSDKYLNKIHDMVFYTLRCLSLGGYLVDCPQIERLGYGGDGNASTITAQTMFNLGPLYANWLDHWKDCIRPDGSMPHTAPNPYSAGGGPYWCGFIITASWNTWQSYGDLQVLEENYPFMKQWLGYVDQYSPEGLLTPWPVTEYRNWYLGDWASPLGVNDKDPESIDLIANCYIVMCLDRMEKIAVLLDKDDESAEFRRKKEDLRKLIHKTFYREDTGIYADGDQIEMAFPLITGVVPGELKGKVSDNLRRNIAEKHSGHFATGLVGIPVMTEWVTGSQSVDLMYSMLTATGYPGYLHMIDNGATTTWEHWNGDRSRIHNCYNGIGSWFYQAAGGIRPVEGMPAYRKFLIDPQVPESVDWVTVEKDTPYGLVSLSWKKTDGVLEIEVTVPVGTEAEVIVPENASAVSFDGEAHPEGNMVLQSGRHMIEWAE